MIKQRNQLLLLEDVDGLGRSGDLVTAKRGYIRNFLLPKKLAVVADKQTLRIQARLQEERAKRAVVDRKEAEELALRINGVTHELEVKVDPDGHMYGSVAAMDIVRFFEELGIVLEKKNVVMTHPIKELGSHSISLRLKEGVPASFTLLIKSDIILAPKAEPKEPQQEAQPGAPE